MSASWRDSIVVLMACALAVPAASAVELSAGELRTYCASPDSELRRRCSFYILGVSEGLSLGVGLAKDSTIVCMPPNMSEAQLVATFQRTADALAIAYPSDMQASAASIVSAALRHEYPCGKRP